MAEYQNTVASSGEMAQRFIEFVLMQAQNAAFMLGQIPHPQTGKPEVNTQMAKLLIDQLVMIQEKTEGNLNGDESRILAGTIANLQMAFVEVVQRQQASEAAPSEVGPAEGSSTPPAAEGSSELATDSKKKFVKSYGS
ncbi:MAG: DUF1844 domain-containing protein [Chthoniobacterales bacterium]